MSHELQRQILRTNKTVKKLAIDKLHLRHIMVHTMKQLALKILEIHLTINRFERDVEISVTKSTSNSSQLITLVSHPY